MIEERKFCVPYTLCIPEGMWVRDSGMGVPLASLIGKTLERMFEVPEISEAFLKAWSAEMSPKARLLCKGGWDAIGKLKVNKLRKQKIDPTNREKIDWTHMNIAGFSVILLEVNGVIVFRNPKPNSP